MFQVSCSTLRFPMINLLSILEAIKPHLLVAQIAIATVLMVLILLQPRGEGLGSAFGQNLLGPGKLRGASKKVFIFTVVIAVAFIVLALLSLFNS